MDHILWYIITGGIAGWLAGLIMKGKGFGLLLNILLGIIGGIVGGWLFGLIGLQSTGGLVGSIVTALAGAVVLIYVARLFK